MAPEPEPTIYINIPRVQALTNEFASLVGQLDAVSDGNLVEGMATAVDGASVVTACTNLATAADREMKRIAGVVSSLQLGGVWAISLYKASEDKSASEIAAAGETAPR